LGAEEMDSSIARASASLRVDALDFRIFGVAENAPEFGTASPICMRQAPNQALRSALRGSSWGLRAAPPLGQASRAARFWIAETEDADQRPIVVRVLRSGIAVALNGLGQRVLSFPWERDYRPAVGERLDKW